MPEREVYAPRVERAWRDIRRRIGLDGSLFDVCTGTGKQESLRAYLDRKAILGRDARGGAMAIMVATEIATWRDEHRARTIPDHLLRSHNRRACTISPRSS